MIGLEKERSSVKPVLFALVLFSIIGISLATETMSRFGMSDNYFYIVSLGLALSVLMLGKRPLLVLCVLVGVLVINLPESVLAQYLIDRDMLLASVCSFILVPTLYDLFLT